MTQKRNAPILFAGYECQEADGDFMLVFASPVQAVNFCLQVLARSFDFLHPYCLFGSFCHSWRPHELLP